PFSEDLAELCRRKLKEELRLSQHDDIMEALKDAHRRTARWATEYFKHTTNKKHRSVNDGRLHALIGVEYREYENLRKESLVNQAALDDCARVYVQKLSEVCY
ncbi:hypothetical protein EG68_12116, partial [Paragonimus skrjabini miyazakii]